MDVPVERLPERRAGRRKVGAVRVPSLALTRALATSRPTGVEWSVAVVGLFLLGRSPVLFVRQRLSEVVGGSIGPIWQEDVLIQSVFAVVVVAVLAFAVRRARPSAILRQPFLLAFIAMAWFSISWSVQPATSARRVALFAGAALVGWYLGDRFSLRDQIRLAGAVAGLGVVASLVAVWFWPEHAAVTNGVFGALSGIYVNRNLFGPVLALGMLASFFMLRTEPRLRPLLVGFIVACFFLLGRTGSQTGVVVLLGTVAVIGITYLVRRIWGRRMPTYAAAGIALAAFGGLVGWIVVSLESFVRTLGRTADLSGRTEIWQVDLWFSRLHPFRGWGFEAIWTEPRPIEQAFGAHGNYPYSSHNGYLEILLGVGWIGLGIFVLFLAVALWQSFRLAWARRGAASLWPLSLIAFVAILNISESFFVSAEAMWVLTVAAAVSATENMRRTHAARRRRRRMAVPRERIS